jgi:DIS3-like exonuclease 1
VGVHIADVSHFVREGGALDQEAQERGTTVYLIDQRVDMLPPLLSENLCSLHAGVDRLAMSVIWTLDEHLEVLETWYGRTVIHSRHKLHYAQAQAILDGAAHAAPEDAVEPLDEWARVRADLQVRDVAASVRWHVWAPSSSSLTVPVHRPLERLAS